MICGHGSIIMSIMTLFFCFICKNAYKIQWSDSASDYFCNWKEACKKFNIHQHTRKLFLSRQQSAETQCRGDIYTVFPRSDAAATINFLLLALAATIRGRRLLEGGVNYTLHDSLLFSSINFDYVMFKSTIFGSDYC